MNFGLSGDGIVMRVFKITWQVGMGSRNEVGWVLKNKTKQTMSDTTNRHYLNLSPLLAFHYLQEHVFVANTWYKAKKLSSSTG